MSKSEAPLSDRLCRLILFWMIRISNLFRDSIFEFSLWLVPYNQGFAVNMISLYCWNVTTRKGTFLDPERLGTDAQWMHSDAHIYWIDLQEPTEEEEKLVLKEFLPVHPLTLLDIAQRHREPEDRGHLPKVEEFPDYLFVVVNPLSQAFLDQVTQNRWDEEILTEVGQISAVLTRTVLITHHHTKEPAIEELRRSLNKNPMQAQRGPDYLFHLVLDAMIDQFTPVLDHLEDSVDRLEDHILNDPAQGLLAELLCFKRILYTLRRNLSYERELLARLMSAEFELVAANEAVYYRNVYDHILRCSEQVATFREMVNDLQHIHLSATSNKLNQIMKVLTIISTTLLPMTLVAGIYGMNFENMPEINWVMGYPWALLIMGLCAVVALLFFRWKKWL